MNWRKWLGLEMTPARFAGKVIKAMQKVQPGLHPVPDLENFRLLISEGNFLNLHNAYHAYQNAPRKEQEAVLEQFVLAILHAPELPASFEEVKSLLLPALRRKSMVDYLRQQSTAEEAGAQALACRDFSPDTVLALAIDGERSMSLVMKSTLEEWGISFDTALDVAMDNLRAMSVDNFSPIDGCPSVISANWCDAYDSSRILLPDLMYRGIGSGNPIIMIPAREFLLLAAETNPETQLDMLGMAELALRESSRWCSTAMYQIVNGKLEVYEPQDGQVREKLRELERNVAMSEYADQKGEFDKTFERDGTDIFVATFSALNEEDGIVSFCTWTEGVHALLPKTDRVALARSSEGEEFEMVMVDWDTLMQRHSGLLKQTPDFPPRFEVTEFPTALFDKLMTDTRHAATV